MNIVKNVVVEKQDDYGRGLVKQEKVIFIKNALPNDIVDINIIKEESNYNEAEVVTYLTKSDEHQEAVCPVFKTCGGCQLLHQKYNYQLLYKQKKVVEHLEHYLKQEIKYKNIASSEELYYRNKITLHVKDEVIGLYEESSNNIVKIPKCYIVKEEINNIYNIICKLNLMNITKVIIRYSSDCNMSMVLLEVTGLIDEEYWINELEDRVTTLVVKDGNIFKNLLGDGYIYDKIGALKLKISPLSFFQVNNLVMLKVYEQIKEYVKNSAYVLDLYSGIGSISLYIADSVKYVVGVESNLYAYNDALINKEINNIDNVSFVNLKCEYLADDKTIIDKVIVDPPRSGLDRRLKEYLRKLRPNSIIYTSCNVNTLTRDLLELSDIYEIKEVSIFDMFSQTSHVECVCLLNIK